MFDVLSAMTVIAVVIYDNMWAFDYGVAVEIWGIDRTEAGVPRFEFRRCSVDGQPVQGHAGMTLEATHDLAGLTSADVILAPGRDHHTTPLGDEVGEALRAAHRRGATVVGMCSGAFTLACAYS